MTNATCDVCPIACSLAPSEAGRCRGRANVDGAVRMLAYGGVSAMAVGPIEQKPFFHFMPGATVLSVGGSGCNLTCSYCQNFEISQSRFSGGRMLSPRDVVDEALTTGASGIAFTYNEPIIMIEYVLDVASLARGNGLFTVLKTNGYATSGAFDSLCDAVDAVNVDVKGDSRAYRDTCGIDVQDNPAEWQIMRNIGSATRLCHVEVSLMVLPGVSAMAPVVAALRSMVPPGTPVHLLRFVPDFRMRGVRPASDQEMRMAYDVLMGHGLSRVYGLDWSSVTKCPSCGESLVSRSGIRVVENRLSGGRCPGCGQESCVVVEGKKHASL